MNAYTIYCYFNADQIQGVLNAVVMLMGSGGVDGDYLSLVRVAALLGSFMAVCYGFLRARGEDAAHYLLLMAIFYTTLFIPRVSVTIEDHGGAGGGAPIVVDHVPIGLAFFASTTSHIGYWLTEKTETFFSLPDTSLRLSSHGLMGGARALRLAQSAAMPDPILAQDVTNFMRECINPELVVSPALVNALLVSKDIWTDLGPSGIGVLNPGRMVTLSGNTGSVQCDDAYTNKIGPRLAPAAASEFARIAQILSPNASPATANTMLASLLPAAEGLIMTASASTTDAIRQRMMINMLNDTSSNMAQIMNDPTAAQTALGTAMATSNANTAYSVLARLAQETLPLVRNAIELVVLGIFPIVLILIIIAGSKGGLVLRSYVMTMLWVQLWAPLYAIVNYVGTMAGAKNFKAALAGIDGVAVNNAAALLNSTISAEAVAGVLTISVPLIALAIIKGGEIALSGITSGITGPADRAATNVGGQVGSGNVNAGNISWGNYNANNAAANHSNTAFAYAMLSRGDVQTEFGSMTLRGSQAGTPNAVGNLTGEYGNIGVIGSHGARVEAAKIGSSGDRAEFTSGTSSGLAQRTSGQFTHQEGATAAAKIQKALENSLGGDWSWLTRDGSGKATTASDRSGTTTATAHTSNIELGGRAGINAGAAQTAKNPVHDAKNKQNAQGAAHVLNGDPYKAASGSNVPPAVAQQGASAPGATTGAASGSSGVPAVGDPAGGGQNGSPMPKGAAEDLQGKANRAAQQLGQAPSQSSYGPNATYGFSSRDTEQKSWSSDRGNTAEIQQRAEKNFDKAARAIEGLMSKTSNSGERAAMQSFLGSLARATDATYQTNVSQSYTQTASKASSRTDANGASVEVNDNGLYGAEALRLAGGSGYRAIEQAVTNPNFREQVASTVARRVAGAVAPLGGSAYGMDGQPIEAPKSVDKQRLDGQEAVKNQRGKDQKAAAAAGQGYLQMAEKQRTQVGAPPSVDMPDLTSAQKAFDTIKGSTERGLNSGQHSAAREAGINRLLEAAFADQAGFGRLLSASLGFGIGTKTHDENRAAIQKLADSNPAFNARLEQIGRHGRVTEDDKQFFSEHRDDGFFDRAGETLNNALQSAKDYWIGK
ncbi:conjugal transfer protein TraG N-terminal domain-containing protein [Sulfuricystis multivorans]|uniref:conjugal transfer protein TraG N-terminal domain-containing protein n=1 Tax=Sulfuricystis multivorans TaxID=2211108 RepID=UPI000F840DD0|nr:conjugal transfer protein TraG N-terminal domain-containing protein [Sulfuricystis multivorans]